MSGRPRCRPVVVGVAGGSASGKSTVVLHLVRRIGGERAAVIHHDAYYRDLSGLSPAEREGVNYDRPDALETDLLVAHVERLRRGGSVTVPAYDFVTHTRRPGAGEPVAPKPVLIVEGMLVLAEPRLRALLDVGVWVDAAPDVRLARRLRRDVAERGRTVESVLDQYERSVRPMHLELVEPSRVLADLLVSGEGPDEAAVDAVVARVESLLAAAAR